MDYFVHASAVVDEGAKIGSGTRIWHFTHVMAGASIGPGCTLGQNVFVASGVTIGANVKIQNNVSVYAGVVLEDDVFCGPSCVFTNVSNPRSEIVRARDQYETTLVRRGATIGANATIVCGSTLGRFVLVGAGAVVTRGRWPDYALLLGVPAKRAGWVSRHGHRLVEGDVMTCPESGWRYVFDGQRVRCLDEREDE